MTGGVQVRTKQALWLNKFEYDGNTKAVVARAEGVLQTGWGLHLVLEGVPPVLLTLYEKHLAKISLKYGLKYSLNINRQQLQNLLFYRDFDLLHVFHPSLFHLVAILGKSFRLPWLADCPDPVDPSLFACLYKADAVVCSCSAAQQSLQPFFHSYPEKPVPLYLIPRGVKIGPPPDFVSPHQPELKSILYAGPLEDNHLSSFQALNQVVQGPGNWTCGIFSRRRPPGFNGNFHPWAPIFGAMLADYTFVAGHGYFLLQALAAGKIALLLEERYAGIFSPFERSEPVPAWRALLPLAKSDIAKEVKSIGTPHKPLRWNLPLPLNNLNPTRKPRGNLEMPRTDQNTKDRLQQDLQLLCTDQSAREKLQQDSWNYTRENHDLAIVAEKISRLYNYITK